MKIPRDVSAKELIKSLSKIGYEVTRQKGSHIRLSIQRPFEHHITIPNHDPIKIGTLSAILSDIAQSRGQSKESIANEIFG